jgi:hypothetical protein
MRGERQPQLVPNDDTTAVNLEHVLPVNPSVDWHIAEEVAAAYHRRIGNMVLLSAQDNVEAGNKKFAEKRNVLKASPFISTKRVGRAGKWGPDEIEARQAELAALAPMVWLL